MHRFLSMCTCVSVFERECVQKFLENASKMNGECNACDGACFYLLFHFFFLFFFFFENCSVAVATRLHRLFRYACKHCAGNTIVRQALDRSFRAGTSRGPTVLCACDWTSRESIERARFSLFIDFQYLNETINTC